VGSTEWRLPILEDLIQLKDTHERLLEARPIMFQFTDLLLRLPETIPRAKKFCPGLRKNFAKRRTGACQRTGPRNGLHRRSVCHIFLAGGVVLTQAMEQGVHVRA
jgi:hypothetical protein